MNNSSVSLRKPLALLSVGLSLFAAQAAFAQTATVEKKEDKKEETLKLEKFTVTGSFIPQASAEPIAPVAIFTEADIRASGAATPIEALRSLPSFVSSSGANENDSNGGSGAAFVSLRGVGASQTLVLLNGLPAGNQSNLNVLPIEAIERIEVMRDGAGIIYGSNAIGGAVNVILKKNYTGLKVTIGGEMATRSPGTADRSSADFIAGASNDKTSIVVTGSFYNKRTLYANSRPNSNTPDNRRFGGTNGGSPTFAGNVQSAALGIVVLKPGFSSSASPTGAGDYVAIDQNGFSSNQLFNFRAYAPSAPGQKRNSLYFNINHQLAGRALEFYGTFFYSQLRSLNGLAPAPFALSVDPVLGPANGSLMQWGPYNQLLGASQLLEDDTDFIRYRSVELGNRANEQVYNDFKYIAGLKGEIGDTGWKWDITYTVDNEQYRQLDTGVPSLPLLDAQVKKGNWNPFALANSTGTATVGGVTYNWDQAKALKAAEIQARQLSDSVNTSWDAKVAGTIMELPAGSLGAAAGYEYSKGSSEFNADSLYASGSVLGLNSFAIHDFNSASSNAVFGEIKVPILSKKNNIPFVNDLTVGALARRETQTVRGTNGKTNLFDSRTFTKTNPSVNFQYSPHEDYKIRGSYSKGFLAPSAGLVFASTGTSNPTIADPLGFPTLAQQTIVIRGNSALQPAESKAWGIGFVAQPKNLLKNFSLTVDLYNIDVTGIIANNANAVLAANAAGQGAGFVSGNAATINPNAPFASQIRRSASGSLNNSGSFSAAFPGVTQRGAVLSDYLNIASRNSRGLEYTATYVYNTSDWGRFTVVAQANQFLRFEQQSGPGLPKISYKGKFVSTVGDPISPGSLPTWKSNTSVRWQWKDITASVTYNHIAAYQDDPLFVLSPKTLAFYQAGTPKSDPAFATFLGTSAALAPKVGGFRMISAFDTYDTQVSYRFGSDNSYLKGLTLIIGANNVFDKLAPNAAGAFNDSYDTRTANNYGRQIYARLSKEF
ncbi:MAG: TonB-dependent receptor [Lacunisphaera sp.]|nr:TonB-dependent receptor [Lacunisphaera sp.]